MGRARVFPREVKRILTPTGGYLRGFTHTLQPYAGCQFRCAYCYVREMSVQRANPYRLPWSEWIAPKTNAAACLLREAQRGVLAGARIFCSSATDPYTPIERKWRLTRGCLEVLVRQPPAFLTLQTRSPLVLRDIDLLARIPTAIVSMTITTDDERVRRLLEPNAPSIALRVDALATLRAAGVPTQVAVSPLLPCDPARLARLLEPVADRVVLDDFFHGDGAGGRRSRVALDQLRAAGYAAWTEPGYADATTEIFRGIFGAQRIGVSAAGFAAPLTEPVPGVRLFACQVIGPVWAGGSGAGRAKLARGMQPKVFIDGHVGTTGLRIREWLAARSDLALLTLPDAQRKDAGARRAQVLAADVAVLCLPDDAAREVAQWSVGAKVRLLDASTAHRVADGWTYGLPELSPAQRDAIRVAKQVSNPGCWPTGFVLLLRPLVDAGLVSRESPITCNGLSGYSGGGNPLIAKWEDPQANLRALVYEAPYATERVHKHVPEMQRFAALAHEPQLVPAVGPFRCGMRVQIPLHAELLAPGATGKAVWETIHERYRGEPFVRVAPYAEAVAVTERSLDPQACNDTNRIDLHVLPHPSGHVLLVAILDNLGKGAAGAAIQNLNAMLGLAETTGLPA